MKIEQHAINEKIATTCNNLMNEVAKVIVGKEELLRYVMVGILSNSHILFEDYPGLAKTLLANTFARALGCTFRRVQFTPDLLPTDIIGTYIFDEKERDFKFRFGPIFTNILLADEINRAPPKTQSALLEGMQERQTTVEGITHKLPKPFVVLATQNPIEYEGTYPLPEAQLDRFIMKLNVGYPTRDEEVEIIKRRETRRKDDVDVTTITKPEDVIEMQHGVEYIKLHPAIRKYIVEIVTRTREDPRIMVGASPRGSLALFKLSKCFAALAGRDYVIPDDVKRVVVPALRHRLILRPEVKIRGVKSEDILEEILKSVPVPAI
jgi:MoxR-like ATPase